MNRRLFLVLLIITSALGCNKEDDELFQLKEEFTITEGERFQNHWHNLSIRFDSLVYDSRCPEGMYCIWAGNANAAFTISQFNRSENFVLDTYTGNPFHNDTALLGFTIKLIALYPVIQYTALLEITKQ